MEILPGQAIFLAGITLALAFQDACGGDSRQAHAVANKQDDVLRAAGHRATRCGLGGTIAEPPGGGFVSRMHDRGNLDDDDVPDLRRRCRWCVPLQPSARGGHK